MGHTYSRASSRWHRSNDGVWRGVYMGGEEDPRDGCPPLSLPPAGELLMSDT